jgi:hypothetical protein
MSSPTQRGLELYRYLGYEIGRVERFNPHVGPHGIRQDLFGIIDAIAIIAGDDPHTLGLQFCAMSGEKDHVLKCLAEPRLRTWLLARNRFEINTWGKRMVGRRVRWTCRRLHAVLSGDDVVFVRRADTVGEGGALAGEKTLMGSVEEAR